jgi:hypothetical protein
MSELGTEFGKQSRQGLFHIVNRQCQYLLNDRNNVPIEVDLGAIDNDVCISIVAGLSVHTSDPTAPAEELLRGGAAAA